MGVRITSPVVGGNIDFALRLVFFAVAPFGLVGAATLVPITGALVSVGIALTVCILGQAVRTRVATSKWLGVVLRRQLAFEAYYREVPPKAFLYYVFYPVLLPYWLFKADGRREFVLYKGFNALGMVILVVTAVDRYFRLWRPELDWRSFVPLLALTLVIESFVVLAFLMPIATSVVALHHVRELRKLSVLLAVGLVSVGIAAVPLLRRHDPIVSLETRARVHLRTARAAGRAKDVLLDALRAAWKSQEGTPSRVAGDGKMEGVPLAAARTALQRYYREDEAAAFDLWASPRKSPKLMVLYIEGRRGRDPIWVGLRDDGEVVRDPRVLPKGAFAAMRHAER